MSIPASIPRLHGSPTHALALEVFQRHSDAGTGLCSTCENPMPCAPSRHAAEVLTAAGDDPAGHQPVRGARGTQARPGQPPAVHWEDDSRGFSVTGRRRPMHPAGYGYERDQ